MDFIRIVKTELYKNFHRKSSLMLFIPILLTIIIAFGFSKGAIKLNLTTGDVEAYSCMDFVFIIWNVLSGLGIIGLLFVQFAAFQFSGEIEHGQIKLMLLRISKRKDVVIGKYVSSAIVCVISIIGTLAASVLSYYIFVARSEFGTGSFHASIAGLSTLEIVGTVGLQLLIYMILIGITFLIGIYAGTFITFIMTIVAMYMINYLAGTETFAAKLLPNYWSNHLALNETIPATGIIGTLGFTGLLLTGILTVIVRGFNKRDIR